MGHAWGISQCCFKVDSASGIAVCGDSPLIRNSMTQLPPNEIRLLVTMTIGTMVGVGKCRGTLRELLEPLLLVSPSNGIVDFQVGLCEHEANLCRVAEHSWSKLLLSGPPSFHASASKMCVAFKMEDFGLSSPRKAVPLFGSGACAHG